MDKLLILRVKIFQFSNLSVFTHKDQLLSAFPNEIVTGQQSKHFQLMKFVLTVCPHVNFSMAKSNTRHFVVFQFFHQDGSLCGLAVNKSWKIDELLVLNIFHMLMTLMRFYRYEF